MKPALALFFVAPLWAQAPPEAEQIRQIEARFAAGTPVDLAWAAYLVGQYNQTQYIPRIIEILQSPDRRVVDLVFEALIRLGVEVPDETLLRHTGQNFGDVVVLASRDPRRHADFLLGLLDINPTRPLSGPPWVAINSILGQIRLPAHASRLMSDWSLKIRIVVTGRGVAPSWPANQVPPGICGDDFGDFGLISDYPRRTLHLWLQEGRSPDRSLVSEGPHPVTYNRSGSCERPFDQDAYRLDYLRWIAGDFRDALPSADLHVEWRSPEQYRADAEAHLGRLRGFVTALRSVLRPLV